MRRACALGIRLRRCAGHADVRTAAALLHKLTTGVGSAGQARCGGVATPAVLDTKVVLTMSSARGAVSLAQFPEPARGWSLAREISTHAPSGLVRSDFRRPLPPLCDSPLEGDAPYARRHTRPASTSASDSSGAAQANGAPRAASAGSAAGGTADVLPPGSDWRILQELGVYVWPRDRPDLRARVVAAVALLLASKGINVQVPYLFKLAVDGLSAGGGDVALAAASGVPIWGIAALTPPALLASYGLARGGAALCNGALGFAHAHACATACIDSDT